MNDHVLPYLKAYAALIGSIATALLAVYTADTAVGQVLTVVSIIATGIATWAVPNKDPEGEHQEESVQPDYEARILGKAWTSGFSAEAEDARAARRAEDGDPNRP